MLNNAVDFRNFGNRILAVFIRKMLHFPTIFAIVITKQITLYKNLIPHLVVLASCVHPTGRPQTSKASGPFWSVKQ